MSAKRFRNLVFLVYFFSLFALSGVEVGLSIVDMTPPLGTPSAGYALRRGEGMVGVHDPLLATALVLDTGEQRTVFCTVDHLGFDTGMVDEVLAQLHSAEGFASAQLFLGSSHTHSGCGSCLDLPPVSQMLSGKYQEDIRAFNISCAVRACLEAADRMQECKIGIGYGEAPRLSLYRSKWPEEFHPSDAVTVLKITTLEDRPLAVLFNYACHPTVLGPENRLFSADFVGAARKSLQQELGAEIIPLFFNGAQGEIIPIKAEGAASYERCEEIGKALAAEVSNVWNRIETTADVRIESWHQRFSFTVLPTPAGVKLPIDQYETSISAILFNGQDVMVAIPGELSRVYEEQFRAWSGEHGFRGLSILGLTNDAHGYLITPEAFDKGTQEAQLSFGGRNHGEELVKAVLEMLRRAMPPGS